jgi:hypothetical protein
MTEDITEAEVFAELLKYIEDSDDDDKIEADTITAPEAQKYLGISIRHTRRVLGQMADEGKLERTMVRRHDGWRWSSVRGYRLTRKTPAG